MENQVATQIITNEKSGRLAFSAARSFGWNLVGSVIRSGSGFLIGVVLARLLGPEPFGLVALAMIVISIGNLIIDSGLGAGLIQKNEISDQDISYVFTIQMALGLVFAASLLIFAQTLAQLFGQPAVIPVIQVLAFQLVLQAASQTATSLLKRQMAFKKIQQAQITSYLVGYLGLGIPLAYIHWGVWSLVIAQLTQSLINLIMVYNWTRHTLRPNLRDGKALTGFGLKVLGANLASWVILNLDNALVGKYFGAINLGYYSRALTLALTPVGLFVSAAQGVLFSTSSRMQEKPEDIRKMLVGIFNILVLMFIPFTIFEAGISKELVVFIYGTKWEPAAPLLVPLALAASFYMLMSIEGPLLTGIGKPHLEMKMQILTAIIGGALMMVGAQISLLGLAWVVFCVYVLRFILVSVVTFKAFQVSLVKVLKPCLYSLFIGAILFFNILIIRQYIQQWHIALQICLDSFVSLGMWLLALYMGRKSIFDPDLMIVISIFTRKFLGSMEYTR